MRRVTCEVTQTPEKHNVFDFQAHFGDICFRAITTATGMETHGPDCDLKIFNSKNEVDITGDFYADNDLGILVRALEPPSQYIGSVFTILQTLAVLEKDYEKYEAISRVAERLGGSL